MAESEEAIHYWRDQVDTLLKSGVAIVILFAGWAVDHHQNFYLGAGYQADPDRFLAAVGLLAISFGYGTFLLWSVESIYDHRIASSTDRTLLPRGQAVWFTRVLALVQFWIAAMMSVR